MSPPASQVNSAVCSTYDFQFSLSAVTQSISPSIRQPIFSLWTHLDAATCFAPSLCRFSVWCSAHISITIGRRRLALFVFGKERLRQVNRCVVLCCKSELGRQHSPTPPNTHHHPPHAPTTLVSTSIRPRPTIMGKPADRVLTRRQIEGMIASGRAIFLYRGKVMMVDAWMPFHPGGDTAIRHMVGRDATDEVSAYVSLSLSLSFFSFPFF